MAVIAACALTAWQVVAEDAVQPLSVPVKVLSTAPPAESQQDMQNTVPMQRPRPQPTTPGGKLPQYQLGHHHRTIPTEAELSDARLRLILALPAEPVLVEATITIDGQPYLMARERRIQQIIEEAARPAPEEPEANSQTESEEVGTVTTDTKDTTEPASDSGTDSEEPASAGNEEGAKEAGSDESDATPEDKESEPESDDEPEAEPVTPPTVPAYSLPPTVAERIRRFMAATGEAATADEVRWLLTNWVDGPVLLMLNDNFQRFRANQRPVFNVLDADRDGTLSTDELANAVVAFERCDFNRNDIVEYTELAKVAGDPGLRKPQHAGPGKLIFRLPDEKSAVAIYRRIAARYPPAEVGGQSLLPRFDVNANGKFDVEELTVLRVANPDLRITISFNTEDPTASRIEVNPADPELAAVSTSEGAAEGSISLPLGGTTVAFSAIQGGESDQISIGAVNDGYPILPVIDPNEDGRFTIRERRGLINSLQSFDRNQDGRLSDDETQATIRICFGLGPIVHRELISLRQVNPNPETPVVTGPDWFVRMDRNGDHDISPREFPGRKEQFAELDTDQDNLVSAQEALDYDKRNSEPANETTSSEEERAGTATEETVKETE